MDIQLSTMGIKASSLALIGSPVIQSKSDHYHNALLSSLGRKERYFKLDIQPFELSDFLTTAKQRSMLGLSVTMPLKECIIPLLDYVDEEARDIGAVNTVKFDNGLAMGYNTDVKGVMHAITHHYHKDLVGKRALILGAGGAAKAIAWGLAKAGMHVTIANRTFEKAQQLAIPLNAHACSFDTLDPILAQCDFLINATPVGMMSAQMIIHPSRVPSHVVVMDSVAFPQNEWISTLAKQGCLTISGKLFWIFQAIEQYKIWYDDTVNLTSAFSNLQHAVEEIA